MSFFQSAGARLRVRECECACACVSVKSAGVLKRGSLALGIGASCGSGAIPLAHLGATSAVAPRLALADLQRRAGARHLAPVRGDAQAQCSLPSHHERPLQHLLASTTIPTMTKAVQPATQSS